MPEGRSLRRSIAFRLRKARRRFLGASTPDHVAWESKYVDRDPVDFHWFEDQPPAELQRLLRSDEVRNGRALDIGCGPGVASVALADRFGSVVAIDIAPSAVAMAKQHVGSRRLLGAVGATPRLPFPDAIFAMVFHRGVLHLIPSREWRAHLGEIARLLEPGGVLQLLEPIETADLSPGRVRALADDVGFDVIRAEATSSAMKGGQKPFTHAVLRRPG